MGLLLLGGKVLDGGDNALGLHSPHLISGHHAGDKGILGEILGAAPAEGAAVDVCTGGIDAGIGLAGGTVTHQALVAQRFAHLLDEFHVPGGCHHRLGNILAGAVDLILVHEAGEAGRAVAVDGGGQVDGFHR